MNRILHIKSCLKSSPTSQKQLYFSQFDDCGFIKGVGNFKWEFNNTNPNKSDLFPLHIADMDYPPPACIFKALETRINIRNYGYTDISNAYYDSIVNWYHKNHNFSVKKDQIYPFLSKTLTGLGLIFDSFTKPGDSIILLTPIYYEFFHTIEKHDCSIIESPLIYKDSSFQIDFKDFEEKILKKKPKIFLFCSPHNPVCRVWTVDEITRLSEICLRYNVLFVSDEVFKDLIFAPNKYHTVAGFKPYENNTIVVSTVGKAFNLNGIETSFSIIKNPVLYEKVAKTANKYYISNIYGNIFSQIVTIAALTEEGRIWLESVREYIYENYKLMCEYFKENLPEIKPCVLEGCFVILCDFEGLNISYDEFIKKANQGNIFINDGRVMHCNNKMFRLNLACSRKVLEGALCRFKEIFGKN